MKPKLLRLHPRDNIAIATAPIKAETVLKLDRVKIQIISNVPMAGKVATRPIAEGEKIIKFGQPIGHATRNIEPGEWVHTHNLASDYLPTPERPSPASDVSTQPVSEPVGENSAVGTSAVVETLSGPSAEGEISANSKAFSSDSLPSQDSPVVEEGPTPSPTPNEPNEPKLEQGTSPAEIERSDSTVQ
ncbi:MAG: UxaA family hydrolase [Thermogutta sp.]|nr:UxaA family hydrolase [Thermogutta sp.]HOP77927.1 UxaA family hydrolase [Thermogutta sp.]HPU06996.1 UxaA family hydrolase [Thermogutta sp.]